MSPPSSTNVLLTPEQLVQLVGQRVPENYRHFGKVAGYHIEEHIHIEVSFLDVTGQGYILLVEGRDVASITACANSPEMADLLMIQAERYMPPLEEESEPEGSPFD